MNNVFILFIVLLLGISGQISAQDDLRQQVNALKPGQSRFLLRGYAHSGLEVYEDNSSFVGGSFNPIFLWQQSDRLLFEGELEVELEEGQTIIGLEYANMSYFLNKWITLRFGKFLSPFGIFSERLHPRWINRLPSNPLGFTHDNQIGPPSELGMEARGGSAIGNMKINYSIYASNGPTLNTGADEPVEAGMLHYDNFSDNNKNKALGGRLGILPFSNSALETGFSFQTAKVGDSESDFENIAAQMYAADLSFVKAVEPLKSVVDVKGQWNQVKVDNTTYTVLGHEGEPESFTFDNESQAYFVRLSVKPAFVENNFIQKLELAGRYSAVNLPENAPWGGERTQWTVGLNYWLDWRTVFKIAYQFVDEKEQSGEAGAEGHGTASGDALLIHWSFGF